MGLTERAAAHYRKPDGIAVSRLEECQNLDCLRPADGCGGRQSLYNTFGDKHALYLQALGRYIRQNAERLNQTLHAPGAGWAEIEAYFEKRRQNVITRYPVTRNGTRCFSRR